YAAKGPGALLALGGVAYDQAPAAVPLAGRDSTRDLELAVPPGPGPTASRVAWPALPGTARELDRVLAPAGAPRPRPGLLEHRGAQAGAERLWRDLPKARWAHLATHGFFAAPDSQARQALLDDPLYRFGVGLERRGIGARNPLTQSGLVLAGANLKPKEG